MQKVVIEIPDNKIGFFLELVNNLGFRKVKRLSREQSEFVDDVRESLEEVEQHLNGSKKLKNATDFLNEL